ncbi:MAG TPA: hypothetical protein VEK82_15625, partial [Stellaceae bacterium]|nr:hypothetical protein [Stellaceae bacterium]
RHIEDAKRTIEAEVHRGGLDGIPVQWLDKYAAGGQLFLNISIAQDGHASKVGVKAARGQETITKSPRDLERRPVTLQI